ncbi:MAG: T9SS type A sorting domain-containing protein [Calditrichales bacterium]|nr:MAG: T9SS type A sorting domain-containing protein [Calditrichales bacterium]
MSNKKTIDPFYTLISGPLTKFLLLLVMAVFFESFSLRAQIPVTDHISQLNPQAAFLYSAIQSHNTFIIPGQKKSAGQTTQNLTPLSIAENFLAENAGRLGTTYSRLNLQPTLVQNSRGATHITFEKIIDGLRVYDSKIRISIGNAGNISFVSGKYRPSELKRMVSPRLNLQEARTIAENYLDVKLQFPEMNPSELMLFDVVGRGLVPAYRVQISAREPRGDWEVVVDAESGEILVLSNRLVYNQKVNGSGNIWTVDPLTNARTYYGGSFVDNSDADSPALNDQRITVTLNDLSTNETGEYILSGPYVEVTDLENPVDSLPHPLQPDGFNFTRQQQSFEAVMVYYHIDQAFRRLLSLGFTESTLQNLLRFKVDPHGMGGADNSYYSPLGNFCAFGEGGVDDAEDPAVIWHEYAHAIQHTLSIVSFDTPGETFSLLEGDADYWAASYKKRISDFEWQQVFMWDKGIKADGGSTFRTGRRCDLNWHYPEDYLLYDNTHQGGQLWSSALMHIQGELGADITDELFVAGHLYWGSEPGFKEAALAIIQADLDIYGGNHLTQITPWFEFHGLIDQSDYQPDIKHKPHPDSENLTGPYQITCQVIPARAAIDTSATWLVWCINANPFDSLKLTESSPNIYSVLIPGTIIPAKVTYYLSVSDQLGYTTHAPGAAMDSVYSFFTGPDTTPPSIEHRLLTDQLADFWPVSVQCLADDNLGVDRVWVEYFINDPGTLMTFDLDPVNDGVYLGTFPEVPPGPIAGDSVFYQIIAIDSSMNRNEIRFPGEAYHRFALYQIPHPPQNIHIVSNVGRVELAWEKYPTDSLSGYFIYRGQDGKTFTLYDSTRQMAFIDTAVTMGSRYFYFLTARINRWESLASDTIDVYVEEVVTISGMPLAPEKFRLGNNYPNPFNPFTHIEYDLPEPANVRLEIYSLLGQRVNTVVQTEQMPGYYRVQWDGTNLRGDAVPSGIYFCRLQAGDFQAVRKMVLVR